jgi:CheY-like chemotaxis protein
VHTDANQLETVLLNLTVNARDAMPAGGLIRITAQAETVAEATELGLSPGGYVRLSVSDNGEGMDAETLARATEPFFTTKGVGKGTGLGLSMAHGLAEQSGGRLVIRSRVGQGTTVDLVLPQAHADEDINVFAGKQRPEGIETLPPQSILAVDDDGLVLMNTVAMLEDLGHRVFAVSNAADALALLRREEVDFVITDYAMPQVNGVQLAEAIRKAHPELPVILATGYAELAPGDVSDLPRLSKPFLQADLAALLRRMLHAERDKVPLRP